MNEICINGHDFESPPGKLTVRFYLVLKGRNTRAQWGASSSKILFPILFSVFSLFFLSSSADDPAPAGKQKERITISYTTDGREQQYTVQHTKYLPPRDSTWTTASSIATGTILQECPRLSSRKPMCLLAKRSLFSMKEACWLLQQRLLSIQHLKGPQLLNEDE